MSDNTQETNLQVFYDGKHFPVVLNHNGYFGANVLGEDDANGWVWRDTYGALSLYFVEREKKREAKARIPAHPWTVATLEDGVVTEFVINGMDTEGHKPRVKGLGRNHGIVSYTRVFKVPDIEERAEYRRLADTYKTARKALREFEEARALGTARDIGRKVDDGIAQE